jgi:1-aminocyclopropane-1-carboxylate deaminase/D-cysteine desulfhydrase-like pyridoxal-dependent ACC family enzyme
LVSSVLICGENKTMNPDAITTQELSISQLKGTGVSVHILRLDLIDPIISGNKWFKLKHYLAEAVATGKKAIVTFGGPLQPATTSALIALGSYVEKGPGACRTHLKMLKDLA